MLETNKQSFNGLFSRKTWVSKNHKGKKAFWILMKQNVMGWQWHQLSHMQITGLSLHRKPCQHPTTPFFTGWLLCFDTQPTVSKH